MSKEQFATFSTTILINFLRDLKLNLDGEDCEVLKKCKIAGINFLFFSKTDFIDNGLAIGPTLTLINLISDLNNYFSKFELKLFDKSKFKSLINFYGNNQVTYSEFLEGDLTKLKDKLKHYHVHVKSLRSFMNYNETALMSSIECFLVEFKINFISEMILEDKKNKSNHNNCVNYAFADIFLFDLNNKGTTGVILELKYLSISGLYNGEKGIIEKPTFSALMEFNKKLEKETVDQILDRRYTYWDKSVSKHKTCKVLQIYEQGYEQLCNYMKIVSRGNVRDNRVKIEGGQSFLRGVLFISIGISNFIIKEKCMSINYQIVKKISIM